MLGEYDSAEARAKVTHSYWKDWEKKCILSKGMDAWKRAVVVQSEENRDDGLGGMKERWICRVRAATAGMKID